MLRLFLFLLSLGIVQGLEAKKKFVIQDRALSSQAQASSLKTLLNSLDPLSLSQQLAFYELYSGTPEGELALSHAWKLLGKRGKETTEALTTLPTLDIQGIISLITRQSFDPPAKLTEEQLCLVEALGAPLSNRKLKGHEVWSRDAVLALGEEEIDLARDLLIFQFDKETNQKEAIRQQEAILDLMALQIQARLKESTTPEEKIKEINRFIFQEMGFRFPPNSLHAADIDLYTFLPSVLDGRQGVCLGVSILYLSLAQRLDLPLEIVTPPGHIYVRFNNGKTLINIETTLRGVDLPSEVYLGINTSCLQKRTLKEVLGLAFMNQAAVLWSREKHAHAVELYEKARLFMPTDPLLKMFLGFNYLFVGRDREGVNLLKEVSHVTLKDAISEETIPLDYLQGKIDKEGIKAVFLPVDETRESILKKQKELEGILKHYPFYRAGLLQLATTWLQLGRYGEAKGVLERYHKIDPHHCIVEYYLTVLCCERLDYNQAWDHLKELEVILAKKEHKPQALLSLRRELPRLSPEF